MTTPKIDPTLSQQLATQSVEDVAAVLTIADEVPEQPPTPDRVEQIVAELMTRVKMKSGLEPSKLKVYRNLGTFLVHAPSSFVKELLLQKEVVAASGGSKPGLGLISPVKRNLVD